MVNVGAWTTPKPTSESLVHWLGRNKTEQVNMRPVSTQSVAHYGNVVGLPTNPESLLSGRGNFNVVGIRILATVQYPSDQLCESQTIERDCEFTTG